MWLNKINAKSFSFVTIIVLLSGLFLSSFSSSEPKMESFTFINNELQKTNKALLELDIIAEMYQNGKVKIENLKSAHAKARLQYKRVEFYLAFYYPEYIGKHINGAPLKRLEFENFKSVLEPEGLQVLDEMIFSEDVYENRYTILGLTKRLQSNYAILYNRIVQKNSSENLIDPMRLQLVRIYTLGITGFDTPGSQNAIHESKASLKGLEAYFLVYFSSSDNPSYDKCCALFKEANIYLENHTNFESFDRLTFLIQYIDPLYEVLKEFQNKSNEILPYTSSWNKDSESIFSSNFLNPYAFTELTKEEDTEALRQLGEKLFYDSNISGSEKISCATCHQPSKGFADGIPKSLSTIEGETVFRNSPTLLNAVYADRFFYDLRAYSLEQQAEHVIFNSKEFNTAYSEILNKLKLNKEYQQIFKKVFGKKDIRPNDFSKALASYVLSLQSFDSEFDKYVRGETDSLSQDIKNGFNLFTGKANCATCHFAPTFSGLVPPLYNENESEILGVLTNPKSQINQLDSDSGRIKNGIYTEEAWIYEKSFKTTTIRNIADTAPYFHNGAYATLEEVIDFYDHGGGAGAGIAVTNQTLPKDALNLTPKEKADLIAFMKSLSYNPAIASKK